MHLRSRWQTPDSRVSFTEGSAFWKTHVQVQSSWQGVESRLSSRRPSLEVQKAVQPALDLHALHAAQIGRRLAPHASRAASTLAPQGSSTLGVGPGELLPHLTMRLQSTRTLPANRVLKFYRISKRIFDPICSCMSSHQGGPTILHAAADSDCWLQSGARSWLLKAVGFSAQGLCVPPSVTLLVQPIEVAQ